MGVDASQVECVGGGADSLGQPVKGPQAGSVTEAEVGQVEKESISGLAQTSLRGVIEERGSGDVEFPCYAE